MYALVLEGGGAKGAYHIGAYKALQELNIEIGAVVGASIGAINGAMIAQGDFEAAYDLWYHIKSSEVFDIDEDILRKFKKFDMKLEDILLLLNKTRKTIANKGIDTSKIKALVDKHVDEEKLRSSQMDFGLATYVLNQARPLEVFLGEIPKGQVKEYILASANFPLFKREKIEDKVVIDGGVFDNLPIGMVLEKGYRDVIAIRTFGIGIVRKVDEKDANIIYISPIENLGPTFHFDAASARKNINLGYYDTLRAFRGLKGRYYYVESMGESFFETYFLKLKKETIYKMGEILGFHQNMPYERLLFEKIIPELCRILNIPEEADYEDVAILFFEEMAKTLKLKRFKVYQHEEFIGSIAQKYGKQTEKFENKWDQLFKNEKLLTKRKREALLRQIGFMLFRESDLFQKYITEEEKKAF